MTENSPPTTRTGDELWRATDAANFVFERFIEKDPSPQTSTEAAQQGFGPGDAQSATSTDRLRRRSSLARSVDLYADLSQRVFNSFASGIADALALGDAGEEVPEPVRLLGRAGSDARGVVWIHNISGVLMPGFRLRMTDLSQSDGSRLSSSEGRIDPARFEPSAEARRSAQLTVGIPEGAGSGIYHGHVLAEGPDAAVAIRLVVHR